MEGKEDSKKVSWKQIGKDRLTATNGINTFFQWKLVIRTSKLLWKEEREKLNQEAVGEREKSTNCSLTFFKEVHSVVSMEDAEERQKVSWDMGEDSPKVTNCTLPFL